MLTVMALPAAKQEWYGIAEIFSEKIVSHYLLQSNVGVVLLTSCRFYPKGAVGLVPCRYLLQSKGGVKVLVYPLWSPQGIGPVPCMCNKVCSMLFWPDYAVSCQGERHMPYSVCIYQGDRVV